MSCKDNILCTLAVFFWVLILCAIMRIKTDYSDFKIKIKDVVENISGYNKDLGRIIYEQKEKEKTEKNIQNVIQEENPKIKMYLHFTLFLLLSIIMKIKSSALAQKEEKNQVKKSSDDKRKRVAMVWGNNQSIGKNCIIDSIKAESTIKNDKIRS